MERGSGILMHISSLPSPYGIGTFGDAAYEFADFLERAGQKYWQILPLSPTGFGDSPYQSCSAFAGNPYFIDFDRLSSSGKLSPEIYKNIDWGDDCGCVDYEKIYNNRSLVLRAAYLADRDDIRQQLDKFRAEEAYWLDDYALYTALKAENGLHPYWEWDEELVRCQPDTLSKARERLAEEIDFCVYVQYRFFEQWNELKAYANSKGIKIIGDIPIYVAEDSADAWRHSEILCLDEDKRPIMVAGCPPDYFSPKGQLWGNPLYDWDNLKSSGFDWWIKRIQAQLRLYDLVRIDHFRGFSAYWAIPFGDEDAVDGRWISAPGKEFFDALKKALGEELPIIAEDLGILDDKVGELMEYTGFPGMKVLQFAFDPSAASDYLPHKYNKNCAAYIGTHDNDTLLGWYLREDDEVRQFAAEYLRLSDDTNNINKGFTAALMASVADVTVFTMQDVLGLGTEARMNVPSSTGSNWQWRLADRGVYSDGTAEYLARLARLYGR